MSESIDALATLAEDAPASQGAGYLLPEPPKHLAPGEVLIAVVDGRTVAVRTIKRVGEPTAPESVQRELVNLISRRLAEMEVVRGSLATAGAAVSAGPESLGLTRAEEAVLARGGLKPEPGSVAPDDPITRAAVEYATLLAESYTAEEAATVLDVNDSRIRQRVAHAPRTLYGIKLGREWRIPKFQFAGRRLVPGIERVVARLPADLHPVAVYRWFTTPNPDLSIDEAEEQRLSPFDWLRTGRSPETVAEIAAAL